MLQDYISAGFPAAEFWGLSPRLFLAQMRGARARLEREQKNAIEMAWLTAALVRAAKLPSLEKLMSGPTPPMTSAEIRSRLSAISSALPKITLEDWKKRRGA